MHRTTINPPAGCSAWDLRLFEEALIASGETPSPGLAERILRAECLAFLHDATGSVLACGALKKPKAEHRAAMFRKAGAQVSSDPYQLELGWLTGPPETVSVLVHTLAEVAGGRPVMVLASTAETHLLDAIVAAGFHPAAPPYPSLRGDYSNQLYLRGS